MANKYLTIERVFDTPVENVWKYFTEPEYFKKWWGPENFTCPVVQIDFKVGGKYLNCMEGEIPGMGKVKAWSTGTYKEIIPMKKIVAMDSFSNEKGEIISAEGYGMKGFPLQMEVSFTFEEIDSKTKLTINYPSVGEISDMDFKNMNLGWNQSLDKLEEEIKQKN